MTRLRFQHHHGHTLVELVVAMGAATLLLAGLASTIFIASRALDHDRSAAVQSTQAERALADVMSDLHHASSFSERAATAVTFQVPDRDGDTLPETMRYSWPDGPGSPLLVRINGGVEATAVENVDHFNLTYSPRHVSGTGFAKGALTVVLFVVADIDHPTVQESARESLFDSWGFPVTLIDDDDSQANYDAAAAEAGVAYVPDTIDPAALGTKLKDTGIGVVNEHGELVDDFSFASGPHYNTRNEVQVLNTTHYITSIFSSTGYHAICSSLQPFSALEDTFAPEMVTLADTFDQGDDENNRPSLVVIEAGGQLSDGTTAAGRRVSVPWGGSGFDVGSLNENGQNIMKRSIEWAAGSEDDA
ncbi:MAG: hypothetical protein R6U98_17490 [Pirellulaceae bacterium]